MIKRIDKFFIISFVVGLIPASFIIHLVQKDFSGFYFLARSYLKYHSHAYQIITNYCNNPINSGLNARAPLVPLLMAISMAIFGRTLLGIYLPFFIARILLLPFTYELAKFYLPKKIAFLSAFLLVIIPKLQTYSFGSPEADVFVALFYLLSMFFYKKSNKLKNRNYALLAGINLGLGALAKSTGFAIGLGLLLAIFIDNFSRLKLAIRKNFILLVTGFLAIIGPYLAWTLLVHHQLYLVTQHDRSIFYILDNLPSLIYTLPLYFGINFALGIKGQLVSLALLFFLIFGVIYLWRKKDSILILPALVTLVLISTLSTCLISGNIPNNYEFVTILGFAMIPVSLIFFIGASQAIKILWAKLFSAKVPYLVITIFMLLLMYKFINNFFTAKYALDFIPTEYYISLPTVIKNREEIPEAKFEIKNGLRIFRGPLIHQEIRQKFKPYEFKPFSSFYTKLLSFTALLCLALFALPENNLPLSSKKKSNK